MVQEGADLLPFLTTSVEELEDLIGLTSGSLTELFSLHAKLPNYIKAVRSVASGSSQKVPASVLSALDRMSFLIDASEGTTSRAFAGTGDPNILAVLDMLISIEEAVLQVRTIPFVLGVDM